MNKVDILKNLLDSNLDRSKFWVLCGAAMVLHGLRDKTTDIDLGCHKEYFEELLKDGYKIKIWDDGMRSINYSDIIDIFEEWNLLTSVEIEGIHTSSIDDLISHKESLNREKDQKDLERLYQYKSLDN